MRRVSLALILIGLTAVLSPPLAATCGGGGGGGLGGATPGGAEPQVYRVAWKVTAAGSSLPAAPEAALVVAWFPTSSAAARASALQTSRALSLAGARCVADALVTPDHGELHERLKVPAGQEMVVLLGGDGGELGRVVAGEQGLDVRAVEKLLQRAIDEREKSLEESFKAAEKRAQDGDATAAEALRRVWDERCLVPSLGRKAAKALKKLGVEVDKAALDGLGPEGLADPDVRGERAATAGVLAAGLAAEEAGRYREAEGLYREATKLDPADPTALRFLGELYRHHTGQWDLATSTFRRVLAQPADPVSRAVALHGLGKMTIHGGEYARGLALFEQSIATYPLPITYRNLAVYWFSEKQTDKATGYMRQAVALEPEDGYNQIFAAVYLAVAGQKEEARRIAEANAGVLAASYNLAALWAQLGDTKKAMELLRRHFYEYERFDAVRAMEMQEARDDYMFAALHADPGFVELTKLASRHQL